MQARPLTRRFALLLPLALAACGGEDETQAFAPLRFSDLPPIRLNVASIAIEQRFIPAGVAPDVSYRDPVSPMDALKAMANDRLQAFGTANKAVFAILDASLTRDRDVLTGSFAVSVTIQDDSGAPLGFAEARVQSRHVGEVDDIRPVLYDMTKALMKDMNVEFEYQIRRHLRTWLTTDTAPAAPVEQAPLDGSGASPAPAPPDGSSAPAAPTAPDGSAPIPLNGSAPPPDGSGMPPSYAPAYPPAPPPSYTPAYPPGYLQPPQSD
jgi:hypothetical protein